MDNGNPNVSCLTNLLADGPENAGNVIKNILVVIDQYKHNGPVWKALGGDNLDKIVELFSGKCRIEFSRVPNLVKKTEMPFDAILSGVIGNEVPCELDLLSLYVRLLKPDGRLMVKCAPGNEGPVIKRLKMCGFLNITANSAPETEGVITGFTPTYKVGSSDQVPQNAITAHLFAAWKSRDINEELIAEDDLLEPDDLKAPVSSSLRVCATTKKTKACKDCSCGLAEELDAKRPKSDETSKSSPDTSNAKSSCGSCYLGDAFRCASCPYLGMPAFKPGEKVKLAGNLLQDDF